MFVRIFMQLVDGHTDLETIEEVVQEASPEYDSQPTLAGQQGQGRAGLLDWQVRPVPE